MTRRRISSGGPWESVAGYSRAVVIGDSCWVAGTTDAGPDGPSLHPDDVSGQARAIFEIIERALIEGGFTLFDVVRTRMFVTDIARANEVLAVHGEVFGDIRPATAGIVVKGLLDPRWRVEVEADAVLGEGGP
jgi:enamine deaminase RidA (YjgF/YER057c/UK114 family)